MKMHVGRLLMACVLLLSSVPPAHALLNANPNGYVDDLSWMPTPQTANIEAHTGLESMQYKMIYAASAATIGFIILYIADPAVRNKVDTWLGFKAKNADGQDTPAA